MIYDVWKEKSMRGALPQPSNHGTARSRPSYDNSSTMEAA